MIFKDRKEAGTKLLLKIFTDQEILKNTANVVIISLLRGGIIIGDLLAKRLETKHLPLIVTKISAPHNSELAIGAVCFDLIYLDKAVVKSLDLPRSVIINQLELARKKFHSYLERFELKESVYSKNIKGKTVVLTDDGIATGSTVKAAILYLKSKNPRSIILAVPVTPYDFSIKGIAKEIILHKNHTFGAVSQFYEFFPQIMDKEVVRILRSK